MRPLCLLWLLISAAGFAQPQPQPPQRGESTFVFAGWGGYSMTVRLWQPENLSADTPIVVVMHGASRDAPRYFEDWARSAGAKDYVVVVPEFPADDFPRSARYNLGFVFDPDTGDRRPEPRWTFSAIEPLFDEVVRRIGGRQQDYLLYGHSAGSQFVHRFLYYKPHARVRRYIAANAGWYTLPDFDIAYPYGLGGAGLDERELGRILAADLVLLLGCEDNDPAAPKLRHTPEAEQQGPSRLQRGRAMYEAGRQAARALGVEFGWRLETVPGADHDNAKMQPAAATFIE